ncbi:MAG: hypothetical protein QXP22_01420 [Candidatus Anstonellales archaeon]
MYLKDKEFFLEGETLKHFGSINKIKSLKGIKLLHVIDIDLKNGKMKNFDVYDALTRFIHVQVETSNINYAKALQKIHARAVLLPPFHENIIDGHIIDELDKNFLAIRIENVNDIRMAEKITDIVTENKDVADIVIKDKNKRLFFIGHYKGSFCNIMKSF